MKRKFRRTIRRWVLLDVGVFRDKTKEIRVIEGVTQVWQALEKAGHEVDRFNTAYGSGWRLNGDKCEWTDVIKGKEPTLYCLPRVRVGPRDKKEMARERAIIRSERRAALEYEKTHPKREIRKRFWITRWFRNLVIKYL